MPFRSIPAEAPALIRALDRMATEHPLDRKVLVATARGAGRELLRTLARLRGGWTGFTVETPRPLALQLATGLLAERGLRVVDEFEEEALVDEALDAAVDASPADAPFRDLVEGIGFRRAVRSSVSALRLAEVGPDSLRPRGDGAAASLSLLAEVLRAYEEGLAREEAVDVAGALGMGCEALEAGVPLPGDQVLLLPGLGLRGISGRFVELLLRRGAQVLPSDPVAGLEPPEGVLHLEGRAEAPPARPRPPSPRKARAASETAGLPLFDLPDTGAEDGAAEAPADPDPSPSLHLFRAAGVHEELREVLRRVMASGRPWDQVEIVSTDPGVYGPALHSLVERTGVGITVAVGLPVERTRPGRVARTYLEWISQDFPSRTLRRLLEYGDVMPDGDRPGDAPHLARELRALRIGWGRGRYLDLLDAQIRHREEEGARPGRHQTQERAETLWAARLGTLRTLRRLLRTVFKAAPPTPGRTDTRPTRASPAQIARGLGALLDFVPAPGEVDRTALERLLRILDRIQATLTRPLGFQAAVGVVRNHLAIRVPAPRAEGKAPWLSDGGLLHLSDVAHGGLTGRPLTFVVGLDAGRFPGLDSQDPLLPDSVRRRVSPHLPTGEDRLRERRFEMASLMARLRGEVVLSYPAWEAAEGRLLQPATVILSAHRLRSGRPGDGYRALQEALGAPASRIPRGSPPLDGEDVWMAALAHGSVLRDGRAALRSRHPALDAGLEALEAPGSPAPSPHLGFVAPRPELDPRRWTERAVSASALEALGACPLRYFYQRALGVYPPDDPEFDLERWLDPKARGSLLHDVFERAVDTARDEGPSFTDPAFRASALEILEEEGARLRYRVPPPSESVFRREMAELGADVRSFVQHLAETLDPSDVVATEEVLGDPAPVQLTLPSGAVLGVRGRVDRVDRVAAGLRVVDYKTGRFRGHESGTGTFDGGRRLQHLIYGHTVERVHGEDVASAEYHFPTRRGENSTAEYSRVQLQGGLGLVEALLAQVASGRFVPTDEPRDCRWCDFAPVCRLRGEGFDATTLRAEWSQARRAEGLPEMEGLHTVREWEKP